MNPDPMQLTLAAYEHEKAERNQVVRQAALHRKALAKRKKAKRGGPR